MIRTDADKKKCEVSERGKKLYIFFNMDIFVLYGPEWQFFKKNMN